MQLGIQQCAAEITKRNFCTAYADTMLPAMLPMKPRACCSAANAPRIILALRVASLLAADLLAEAQGGRRALALQGDDAAQVLLLLRRLLRDSLDPRGLLCRLPAGAEFFAEPSAEPLNDRLRGVLETNVHAISTGCFQYHLTFGGLLSDKGCMLFVLSVSGGELFERRECK